MSENVVYDFKKIEQVASISSNKDASIGKLIAEAMKKVSKDGVITVEEAKGTETYVEVVEGMQFDRGYLSPYFITDADKMVTEYENPLVLIHDKKITNVQEIFPKLEKSAKSGRLLLKIEEDMKSNPRGKLGVNR